MKLIGPLILVACAVFFYGCASTVPSELLDARVAFKHASAGSASQLAPVDLHNAQQALTLAELSFSDDAEPYRTKDLAYVAQRKAELAEAQASVAMEQRSKARADSAFQMTQGKLLQERTQDLSATRTALAASERSTQDVAEQLSAEQKARLEAEQKTAAAEAALAALADVKEEERGTVITLSGSVLFLSGDATLMSGAQARLDQVADALLASPDRNVVVEGYTDSQGSDTTNLDLSQRRADAVREYLVHRGYPAVHVQAHGIGEGRPVADNASSEGRANNRRVEIVLERAPKR